ncbi:MAG: SAM hydroxide adenosyltransferase [Planctomycetota bacterium]|nr:SAM hydroxide adenosyltransferase [Planctomycetota bacterium]
MTGKLPVDFGHPVDPSELAILQLARPVKQLDSVWGEILLVDRFGNLISNIDSSLIPVSPAACTVVVGEQEIQGISYTYSDLPPGKLMCLTGSNQRLEVAVNCGNASQQLNLHQGAPIKVNW